MKNNRTLGLAILSLLLFIGNAPLAAKVKNYTLSSPDGGLKVEISTGDGLSYRIMHENDTILSHSNIGLVLADGTLVGKSSRVTRERRKKIEDKVESPFYRFKEFVAVCNELDLKLQGGFGVTFRAYNDGVAYRFYTTVTSEVTVKDEVAEFNFPQDYTAYLPYTTNDKQPMAMAFQNVYDITPLSKAQPKLAFLPVTVDCGSVKLTLLESDLEAYPGMFVQSQQGKYGLKGVFAPYPAKTDFYPWRKQEYVTETTDFISRSRGSRSYPWRVLAITEKDTDMPVNNLVYALASPNRIGDTSWVKTGKVAWDWWNDWNLKGVPFKAGINMDTYKYYIDFASRNGIEFIVLDEGWYDPKSGDMLTVIPELDLPELIAYGKSKGVEIVLWTVFNVLDSQLEAACKKYADMGIKGFKVDFLDRDDQTAVEMVYRIAEMTARYKLTLDLHGIYKPTGINRTYPHIINFESVFGMEEVKWTDIKNNMPLYDVTFPYIRMMAGPVDYTPGAMRNATKADWRAMYSTPASMGTRCHQLAAYIVHDSPFTMLCDAPTNYLNEQECVDFITSLPVETDSTFIASGELGKYIVTVRKKDVNWYVGGMTNWDRRDVELDFSFLPEGVRYMATLFVDGINADKQAEDYRMEKRIVDRESRMKLHLASGGGFAMKLELCPLRGRVTAVPEGKGIPSFYKKYIEKTHKLVEIDGVQVQISTHPNVLHIHTTYFDNLDNLSPEFLKEVEDMKVSNPEKYAHVVIGRWADVAEGAVFKKWGIVDEFPAWAKKIAFGQDFGYTHDPSASIRCGIVDNALYLDEVDYRTGLLSSDIIKTLRPWGLKVIADSADPRLIQEIHNGGIKIYAVEKGAGSINAGIDKMKDMEIYITKRSYNLQSEFRKYVWAKDKDGNYINEPEDHDNHGIDAVRYYVLGELLGKIQKPKDLTGIFTH